MLVSEFIMRHQRILLLTGAGVSTASGIPSYRDADGEWKHQRPIEYRDFIKHLSTRQRYWARAYVGWKIFNRAEPNPAHHAIAQLESMGKLSLTITQNVDGLHQRAGTQRLIEMHGSLARVGCLTCQRQISRSQMQARLLEKNPVLVEFSAPLGPDGDAKLENNKFEQLELPACEFCGGTFKPTVVFFGEALARDTVKDCDSAITQSDAMLVVGSSLVVFSGFRLVRDASQLEMPVLLLNQGKTRADNIITHKVQQDCAVALSQAVQLMGDNASAEM